jgi:hypothetical protein
MVLCRACWIDQINHARNHTTNLLRDVVSLMVAKD